MPCSGELTTTLGTGAAIQCKLYQDGVGLLELMGKPFEGEAKSDMAVQRRSQR